MHAGSQAGGPWGLALALARAGVCAAKRLLPRGALA